MGPEQGPAAPPPVPAAPVSGGVASVYPRVSTTKTTWNAPELFSLKFSKEIIDGELEREKDKIQQSPCFRGLEFALTHGLDSSFLHNSVMKPKNGDATNPRQSRTVNITAPSEFLYEPHLSAAGRFPFHVDRPQTMSDEVFNEKHFPRADQQAMVRVVPPEATVQVWTDRVLGIARGGVMFPPQAASVSNRLEDAVGPLPPRFAFTRAFNSRAAIEPASALKFAVETMDVTERVVWKLVRVLEENYADTVHARPPYSAAATASVYLYFVAYVVTLQKKTQHELKSATAHLCLTEATADQCPAIRRDLDQGQGRIRESTTIILKCSASQLSPFPPK